MKNDSPFTHSTGYLICTSVPAKRAIHIGLRNTPQNLFPNNKHLFYKRSKPGFNVNVALTTPMVILHMTATPGLVLHICWNTYNQNLTAHAI